MDSPASDKVVRLDEALRRLASAIDLLEAAAQRRAQADAARADLVEELAVMQDDRARLALDLDGALARARALEGANLQAARRLEAAGHSIRALIEAAEGGA